VIGPRLLIVEDEVIVAHNVAGRLQQLGYTVVAIVRSGEEAVQEALKLKPDLVLMDISLPGQLDGIAAAAEINVRIGAPVVYLTGYADAATLERAKATAAYGYVSKPFEFRELASTIEIALAKHALVRQLQESEQALRQERDFAAAVVDTVGALIAVLDPKGRIVRFNRACEETTGYTAAEVQGRPFWDLFLVPEEAPAVRAVFERLRAGDFPNEFENHWLTRGGQPRLIAWSNTVLVDGAGQVEHIIATGIDITKRKQAEEALQDSELRYRRLFEAAQDGILILDADTGQIINANPFLL
jgi:PAS domain S-box-containing protein